MARAAPLLDGGGGVSSNEAVPLFLSSVFATGVLGFPFIFSRTGTLLGLLLLLAVSATQAFSLRLLLFASTVTDAQSLQEVFAHQACAAHPYPFSTDVVLYFFPHRKTQHSPYQRSWWPRSWAPAARCSARRASSRSSSG